MKKYMNRILATVLVLALTGCAAPAAEEKQDGADHPKEGGVTCAADDPVRIDKKDGETVALQPFKHINLGVKAADIVLETGSEYAVTYHLHDRENLERAEVVGDTFYFRTGMEGDKRPEFEDWYVKITVPESAFLENIRLFTVAGNIRISDRVFGETDLETTAGSIEVSCVTGDALEMDTVSGDILLSGSNVLEVSAENKTGRISLEGDFNEAEVYSVSGSCELSGMLLEEAEMETVSGSITVRTNAPAMEAESVGGVFLNGEKKGRVYEKDHSGAELDLKSVSGEIHIYTEDQ